MLKIVVSNPEPRLPQVGDEVYVPSDKRALHYLPDFEGGRAEVSKVELLPYDGREQLYVTVHARPEVQYRWSDLAPKQCRLRWQFRDRQAYLNPDFEQEFTDDASAR